MRDWPGLWLLACIATAVFGLFLALCGNPAVALALTLAFQALFTIASNAKHAMLGEALLFSDLALVGAIFRHPQFYLSAVPFWQRVIPAIIAAMLLAVLVHLSNADLVPHLLGLALLAGGLGGLVLTLGGGRARRWAPLPNAYPDIRRLGLFPTLLIYWLRWRDTLDPRPCEHRPRKARHDAPEVVVVIQCESFADPIELFGEAATSFPDEPFPGLARARANAVQWGDLHASGFGAYTMRTEYGVLFGRDEDALGFRRYDPYLTAAGEGSYGLPARLRKQSGRWQCLFVHPHDMRFYGRDRIMPAAGFTELVGEKSFAPPGPGEGRYVTDAAMADRILALTEAAIDPTLIYAVTIENHGPWAPHGDRSLTDGYLRLARKGDEMLTRLLDGLAAQGRPALLVFFGDHRPSIPGATTPPSPESTGGRHTPYVMLRIDAEGRVVRDDNRRADLTPAELHHAILEQVLGPIVPE